MKKQFISVVFIAVVGLAAFLVSCGKDETKNDITCQCRGWSTGGDDSSRITYTKTRTVTASAFGANNCDDLAVKLEIAWAEVGLNKYSCN